MSNDPFLTDVKTLRARARQHPEEGADWIAWRILELGGEPDLDPESLGSRSHSEYVAGESLDEMILEDLMAELIAIESDV